MKKIYFSVVTILAALTLNAQQTIGFEGIVLSPESFNNGSSGTGGFIENGVVFSNLYNQSWGGYMESGFAISNTTDVTTAGFTNQYSSYAGSGDNSTNYAVCYSDGTISFLGQGVDLDSIKVTNTTYAALSMKDGDQYGKQFGSVNGADGNPDGTNGEDFYKLTIFAHAADGHIIDSVGVYLADYRFTDNSQDYIVNTWKNVDLSFIDETVFSLTFGLNSSDIGDFGILTPAYFAIDNLSFSTSVGLTENTLESVSVYPNPMNNELIIKGESGKVELFDVTGKVLISEEHTGFSILNVSELSAGSYTLKVSNERGTLIQKVVK
jgi:hypothetical protein